MNRDLDRLLQWASLMARTDKDVSARPLWAQIAREVESYVEETAEATPAQTGADLFGGGA